MSSQQVGKLAKELREVKNLLSKNKAQAKVRPGSRKAKKNRLGGSTRGGAAARTQLYSAPAAAEVTMSLTRRTAKRPIRHPYHGDGFEVEFVEPLAIIQGDGSSNAVFIDVQGAVAGGNTINIGFDAIGGDLALEARTFDRGTISEFEIIYLPAAATSTTGTFSVGYVQDSRAGTFATISYDPIQKIIPNGGSTYYGTSAVRMVRYVNTDKFKTWFTETDSTSSASYRQTVQGALYGAGNAAVSASVLGRLMIVGKACLYQRCADFGFTVPRNILDRLSRMTANMSVKDRALYLENLLDKASSPESNVVDARKVVLDDFDLVRKPSSSSCR